MATSIKMSQAVTGEYGSKSRSSVTSIEEASNKIRLHMAKKYGNDLEKIEEETAKAIDRIQLNAHKKTLKQKLEASKEFNKEELQLATTAAEKVKAATKSALISGVEAIGKAASNAMSSLNTNIEQYFTLYDQYMSGIEARIQGSGQSFKGYTSTIKNAIGSSPYVSQTKVLENLANLVDKGIAYNVEQRAFLATVSDKIATTFNAFDSNLLQLIRIQRADSTAARLGMEATLTQFLNSKFSDTSYLSDLRSSVSGTLTGTLSSLGLQQGLETEYAVQKWLGALNSVGLSSSTIQSLAQGINYLGTGDITGLSGNESLMRLFSMASGGDITGMLTGGLTSSSVNKLLENVVKFGQSIASNTNQVVRAQYANLFGLTISDMTALLNLSSKDLVDISKNMLTYSGAVAETTNQLEKIPERMMMSEKINTMFQNVMATVGTGIANNAVGYTSYLLADLVQKATGGIEIPLVSAVGSFVDVKADITQLMKTGIAGMGIIGELGTILGGLSGAKGLTLNNWGAKEALSYGAGFTGLKIGTPSTSSSTYIGSGSGEDIYESSVAAAKEKATENITGQEVSELTQVLRAVDEIYKILYRVSGYGGNVFKVDTEEGGWAGASIGNYRDFRNDSGSSM